MSADPHNDNVIVIDDTEEEAEALCGVRVRVLPRRSLALHPLAEVKPEPERGLVPAAASVATLRLVEHLTGVPFTAKQASAIVRQPTTRKFEEDSEEYESAKRQCSSVLQQNATSRTPTGASPTVDTLGNDGERIVESFPAVRMPMLTGEWVGGRRKWPRHIVAMDLGEFDSGEHSFLRVDADEADTPVAVASSLKPKPRGSGGVTPSRAGAKQTTTLDKWMGAPRKSVNLKSAVTQRPSPDSDFEDDEEEKWPPPQAPPPVPRVRGKAASTRTPRPSPDPDFEDLKEEKRSVPQNNRSDVEGGHKGSPARSIKHARGAVSATAAQGEKSDEEVDVDEENDEDSDLDFEDCDEEGDFVDVRADAHTPTRGGHQTKEKNNDSDFDFEDSDDEVVTQVAVAANGIGSTANQINITASRAAVLGALSSARWPHHVAHLRTQYNPKDIRFEYAPNFGTCSCAPRICRHNTCVTGSLGLFCAPNCCPFKGECGNSMRESDRFALARRGGPLGLTVITTQFIEEGTIIGEYLGEMTLESSVLTDRVETEGYRLMMLQRPLASRGLKVCINAKQFGSLMRFLNHSYAPVAKFAEASNGNHHTVVAVTTTDINAGQEITVDYGKNLWFLCKCGAKNCRGRKK